MSPNSKIFISRKAFTFIGIAILAITIIALYILSSAINKNNIETYKYITNKNFNQKLHALELEFKKVDDHIISLDSIISSTPINLLPIKFKVLNEVYNHGNIIDLNWYILLNSENEIKEYYLGEQPINNNDNFYIQKLNSDLFFSQSNHFINIDGTYYWLINHTHILPSGDKIIYGITIDMNSFHKYLTLIDDTTANYAYIFTREGLCIYHPEIAFIGKNLFRENNLSPKDTISPTNFKNPPIVTSEYINIDIFRYVHSFNSENFDGYIAINFPKVNTDENTAPIKKNTSLIFVVTISLIFLIIYLFNILNKKAYKEKELLAVENEKISKEYAQIQLQQLKNQINPHFLFNSLNSLYMLIDLDRKIAQKFTLNLSKTYRYLITPPTDNIVDVNEEINFIKQFITLQQIRFKQELHFDLIDKRQTTHHRRIPFLALQITVENALKHNIATIENPLLVQVIIEENQVTVINNYQPKSSKANSELFGLKYLKSIYNYYGCDKFRTIQDDATFTCILPYL